MHVYSSSLVVASLALISLLTQSEPTAPGVYDSNQTLEHPQAAPTIDSTDPFGTPPPIPKGALSPEVAAAVNAVFRDGLKEDTWDGKQLQSLVTIVESKDVRLAWLALDMMRMPTGNELSSLMLSVAADLTGIRPDPEDPFDSLMNPLMAWEVPAPPGYLESKRAIYTQFLPEWEKIMQPGDIEWQMVTWGGVLIDDRPFDKTDERCNCIPAADNPPVTSAEDAQWLRDDEVVFGIVINGEARAYPRRTMEVREMVNDTLGGRDLGIPYCTLCGSAQAYYTDVLPEGVERPILRTSGLLVRSNKVMYDLVTYSVFDTFLGKAVTGPLAEKGVVLSQAGVITTSWGAWRKQHPSTTVLEERLAMGRDFDFRNGRDSDGPIFPIGRHDPRLPVQEDVVGVITASGQAVAFQVTKALEALDRGEDVTFENVTLLREGDGLRAVDEDGSDIGGHQAFWFAWSQFHKGTELWGVE